MILQQEPSLSSFVKQKRLWQVERKEAYLVQENRVQIK